MRGFDFETAPFESEYLARDARGQKLRILFYEFWSRQLPIRGDCSRRRGAGLRFFSGPAPALPAELVGLLAG